MLEQPHGASGLTVRSVDLGFGEGTPLIASVRRLNLRSDILVQSGIGQQLGLHYVRIILGHIVAQLRDGLGMHCLQNGKADRRDLTELSQPILSERAA